MDEKIPLRLVATASLVGSAERMLDVGCGEDGALFPMVQDRFRELYGLDRYDIAVPSGGRVIAKKCDLDREPFPFKDSFFDRVACADVIEHVRDPLLLMTECFRVLKPGGGVVVTTPNVRFYPHLLELALRGRFPKTSNDPREYDGGHLHFFTFKDVRQLLERAGFQAIEEYGLYRWEALSGLARYKDRIKALMGDSLKREFFSGGVVARAWKAPAHNIGPML